ncbi:hypothetical protein ABK040_005582 [Willaertia magna]
MYITQLVDNSINKDPMKHVTIQTDLTNQLKNTEMMEQRLMDKVNYADLSMDLISEQIKTKHVVHTFNEFKNLTMSESITWTKVTGGLPIGITFYKSISKINDTFYGYGGYPGSPNIKLFK